MCSLTFPATIIFFSFSIMTGLFFFFKPASAIELQRKFYEKINWRIEPIDMQKEIKNTRIMGLVVIILVFFAFIVLVKTQAASEPFVCPLSRILR